MTIEEAIAHAKEHKEIFGGTHKEFLDVAIEALEKQMPYKVVNEGDKFEKYGTCKCGGIAVNWAGMLYNYCPKCGQKLDWSEEE